MTGGLELGWSAVVIAAAAALAGLVRGFAGFGSAMVFMPIAAASTTPETALVLLFLTGTPAQIPILVRSVRQCTWREVAPLALGAAIMVPVGVKLLLVLDPALMRLIISLLVLVLVAVLASGWRYGRTPGPVATTVIGGGAGLGGGMAGLYGPVIVLFWLGGQSEAPTVRANLFAFFGALTVIEAATFLANSMITWDRIGGAVLLLPLYGAALWAGSKLFALASGTTFRRIALALCAASAIIGLVR